MLFFNMLFFNTQKCENNRNAIWNTLLCQMKKSICFYIYIRKNK